MENKMIIYTITSIKMMDDKEVGRRVLGQCPTLKGAKDVIEECGETFREKDYDMILIEEKPSPENKKWKYLWNEDSGKWKIAQETPAKRAYVKPKNGKAINRMEKING